ncbi:MAG TPA: LysR substrate-binding domain-containing protein [Burkholderiaceae bacterium]|jgi:LysR family nitrogen assimilation transcriptional regulator|nr:LysR substrate-binding domain-containing protein [Burkholderiaceae bacterium]
MNLKHLESFVRVAELGSFSKAARVLDIAQPALSRQVRSLETDLRETLLLRNGRGVTLTDAGQRLFEHGVQILQRVSQAREDLGAQRDAAVGHVTIGLPPSIGRRLTLPLIESFREHLPRARLTIVEGLSAHIAEWIGSGRADLGLLYNPDAQPALEITPLLQERLCLVEAVRGRKGNRGPVPLRELGAFPLILPERHQAIRRLLQTQANLAGVKLHVAWEVSSVPAIIDLVCARVGYAVLNASAVDASGRGSELAVRPIVEPELPSVLFLAQSATKPATPLTRRVARLLTELIDAPRAPARKAKR